MVQPRPSGQLVPDVAFRRLNLSTARAAFRRA